MRLILLLLFLFMSIIVNAQDDGTKEINIHIACGYAGVTSTDVRNVQRLMTSKSYVLLKRKLFGDNKSEAVLSVISLQELHAKGVVTLTNEEQQRINTIATWNDKYSVCYTCTEHFEGTINELLTNKRCPAYLLIRKTVLKTN